MDHQALQESGKDKPSIIKTLTEDTPAKMVANTEGAWTADKLVTKITDYVIWSVSWNFCCEKILTGWMNSSEG